MGDVAYVLQKKWHTKSTFFELDIENLI